MAGFVAELMVFRGSLLTFPLATLLSMVGSGLTAVYFLLLVNRAFFGRLATEPDGKPPALLPLAGLARQAPAVVLAAGVVLVGLWPQGLTNLAVASTSALGQPASGAFTAVAMAGASQPAASDVLQKVLVHGG